MPRALVLCYHAVTEAWRSPLAVPESAFQQQISSLLARGYRGADLETAGRGGSREVHVTFDDAYASIPGALAVLGRCGIGATVFVVTSCALSGSPPSDHAHDAAAATLTWDELRAIASRGTRIGSHTVTHPHLTELGDAELRNELVESRSQIEDELGLRCTALAYPYGDTDDRVRAASLRAGYETTFGAGSRSVHQTDVKRVCVFRGDGSVRFRLKTSLFGGAAGWSIRRDRFMRWKGE